MAEKVITQSGYRVVFERDDNNRWFVPCPDVSGAHSHGRTLASARTNIREAIALVLDLAEDMPFDLVEEIHLPDVGFQEAVDRARSLRDHANVMDQQARDATSDAISRSFESEASLGFRDLADLLGISHQRVQQLAAGHRDG